jgi:hypothetical protein
MLEPNASVSAAAAQLYPFMFTLSCSRAAVGLQAVVSHHCADWWAISHLCLSSFANYLGCQRGHLLIESAHHLICAAQHVLQ